MLAVPLPLFVKLRPAGSGPLSPNTIVPSPVAVMVKESATPTTKVAFAALVMTGGWMTLSVKLWVASGTTPFVAVMVKL